MRKKMLAQFGLLLYWATWPAVMLWSWRRRSARVVVICEGKLLLVRSWFGNGKWMLPGGGKHYKESAESAALRELKEETGVVVATRDLKRLCESNAGSLLMRRRYNLFVVVRSRRPRAYPSKEIIDLDWVSWHEIHHENVSDDVLLALQYLQKYSEQAAAQREQHLKTVQA